MDKDAKFVLGEYVDTLQKFEDLRREWSMRIRTFAERRDVAVEQWRGNVKSIWPHRAHHIWPHLGRSGNF